MKVTRRGVLLAMGCLNVASLSTPSLSFASPSHLNPISFGADPDGNRDCTLAFQRMFATAIRTGLPCVDYGGTYKLANPVIIRPNGASLSFTGAGKKRTTITMTNNNSGLVVLGDPHTKGRVEFSGFSIGRNTAEEYTGKLGARAVAIFNCSEVTLDEIEEWGGIGFGLFLDYCGKYTVKNCLIRDHKGGFKQLSGTDGLHFYRCSGPGKVFANVIRSVGDDAISFGSFSKEFPTTDFECFSNEVESAIGSIKVYGCSNRFKIYDNHTRRTKVSGVVVWDDRGEDQSFHIYDGQIYRNVIREQLGAGISGGISVWSPTGSGSGYQSGITIRENTIFDCANGVTVASSTPSKYVADMEISNNRIEKCRGFGIRCESIARSIRIEKNTIRDVGLDGIVVKKEFDLGVGAVVDIDENVISGYAQSRASIGISVDLQSPSSGVAISNNSIGRPGFPSSKAILRGQSKATISGNTTY